MKNKQKKRLLTKKERIRNFLTIILPALIVIIISIIYLIFAWNKYQKMEEARQIGESVGYLLQADLWKMMVSEFIMVVCWLAFAFTLFIFFNKNKKYKETEKSRKESERSKSVFFSNIPGMAYRCKNDYYWTMEFVSEGCYELTGYKVKSLIMNRELSYFDIISPEHHNLVRDKWERVLTQHKRYRDEYKIITKSGEHKWVLELGQGIYGSDGKVEALEGIVLDISDRKKMDFQITHLRDRDFLTGLYNRTYMEQERKRLDHAKYLPLSVAICDIDGLRVINDAYGYEEGDFLIIKTGQLIKNCLRHDYVIGHVGGGEYMIIMPNTDKQAADKLKNRIKNSIESYNRVNVDAPSVISVSIGHSTKETKDQDMNTVIAEANEYLRRSKMLNKTSSHSAIVSSIMATLHAKSQETQDHGERLGGLCLVIGKELGLSQGDLDDLQLLSKLHDIGKIGIDDNILNKPGKLDEEEWEIMKQHPAIGHSIAMATTQLQHIAEYILHHHERWDGKGYPIGLKGKEIPLASRILSIVDAFDAMTQDRVYEKAIPVEDAFKEIELNAGSQFDPDIARLFLRIVRENREDYI